jgi:hypothetical protein
MNTAKVANAPSSWARLLFSKTVVGLHAPLVVVILGVALALLMKRERGPWL